jgi:4-amino-4-deoxy-L-arabinose transferase-like glycosyltransferase
MKWPVFFFILIIIIASSLRIFQLGLIPQSMSDDEVRLVYNAYSVWKTGKDITGRVLPFAFVVDGYAFNPVPIYITAPFVGIFGLSMFTGRLPFALAGVGTIICLYILSLKLLNYRTVALLSAFLLSISVWHLQLSRFAYEGGMALFFYFLGITLFIYHKKYSYLYLVLSLIVFFLAFFSYSGTKLIFIPLIAILTWYKASELKKKQIWMIVAFICFIFGFYFLMSKTQGAAQYGTYQFFFQDRIASSNAVELERRASTAPLVLKTLYHNKYTYWVKIFIDHYSYAFSPQYLFISQEGSGIFSIWFRGQLFYIDAPLLILGLFYIFLKKRKEFILLIILTLIAPIPSGIGASPYTYTIRSCLLLLPFMIFTASGIYAIVSYQNKMIRIALIFLVVSSYLYLFSGYLTQYYFEWSRYGAKYYSKGTKDMVEYVNTEKNSHKEILIGVGDVTTVAAYAFYSGLSPKIIQNIASKQNITIDNVSFRPDCALLKKNERDVYLLENSLYIARPQCNTDLKKIKTIMTSDNQEIEWNIYKN